MASPVMLHKLPSLYDWDFGLVPVSRVAHINIHTGKLQWSVLRIFGFRVAVW